MVVRDRCCYIERAIMSQASVPTIELARAAQRPTRGHVLPLVGQDGASSRVSRCGSARRVLAGPGGQTPAPFYAW